MYAVTLWVSHKTCRKQHLSLFQDYFHFQMYKMLSVSLTIPLIKHNIFIWMPAAKISIKLMTFFKLIFFVTIQWILLVLLLSAFYLLKISILRRYSCVYFWKRNENLIFFPSVKSIGTKIFFNNSKYGNHSIEYKFNNIKFYLISIFMGFLCVGAFNAI